MTEAMAYWPHRSPSSGQENVTAIVQALMGISGLTQKDLAVRLELDTSTVSNKMTGKRRWSIDDIDGLARSFNVPRDLFLRTPADVFGAVLQAERDKDNPWGPGPDGGGVAARLTRPYVAPLRAVA